VFARRICEHRAAGVRRHDEQTMTDLPWRWHRVFFIERASSTLHSPECHDEQGPEILPFFSQY